MKSNFKSYLSMFLTQAAIVAAMASTLGLVAGCRGGASKGLSAIPRLNPAPLKIPQIWHQSLDEALKEAASTGKPILVNFTGSDWCTWCIKLKKDVFETDTFGKWAENKVILVSLDFPRRSLLPADVQQRNQEIAKKYQVNSYPTTIFLDSAGTTIGTGPGYNADPQAWIAQADQVLAVGK